MKKLRVLALVHTHLVPPADTTGLDVINAEWKMEFDVATTLEEMGHEVKVVGVHDDLGGIRRAVEEFKPDILFNLLEAFADITTFDQNVVSYLELLRRPYTGCNPRGLTLARDKSLSKKLLAYHRIPVPDFTVVRRGRKPALPKRLRYPLIVKSLFFESSTGISQASVVDNDVQLERRVQFVHDSLGTPAIVEQFIDGRELYVGVIGNERVQAFPVWEMFFTNMPENARNIATERVKWNTKYQQRHGIQTDQAVLPDGLSERIQHIARRAFKALDLSGYARIDFRLDAGNKPFVIEANANPQLAYGEDFAESAEKAGLSYEGLLERIINLGLQWQPERTG
jgi:D-alanine-D-alanine ligase